MTQTHRFTEPAMVIDLANLKRVRATEQRNEPPPIDEDYEIWLDELEPEELA